MESWRKRYKEDMSDPRWWAFRERVFQVKGSRCEDCHAVDRLNVHHPYYNRGWRPWQYDPKEVRVLCESCHKAIDPAEERVLRAFWAAYLARGTGWLAQAAAWFVAQRRLWF